MSEPHDEDAATPVYATVESWVIGWLLPNVRRPYQQTGMVRWHWCEQWWRHDEAVLRLTALWYLWETVRTRTTGMVDWLRELDHHLPILLGPDGPFRDCAPRDADRPARHSEQPWPPTIAAVEGWWAWWPEQTPRDTR